MRMLEQYDQVKKGFTLYTRAFYFDKRGQL